MILRNLDVLLRGAAAVEHAGEDEDAAFSPELRRGGRRGRGPPAPQPPARLDLHRPPLRARRRATRSRSWPGPQPLPELGDQIGERSFYEGGLGVDYSVGARRFNASGELYGRAYDRA